ncbi:MAG: 3-isopropylmalate dehydratase [Deltaproteobacteria bacterium]|nr:3-isopropylmalate dehydratase [Deltaproteobacteria bacterium]
MTTSDPRFVFEGRVWLLGDDVDTDELAPFGSIGRPWEEARPTLLPSRPELPGLVESGDLLVAGKNFGCGSSREMAVENLRKLGFACVVAESFARIFFRNCIANAFPALSCRGVHGSIEEGTRLTVDLCAGRLSTEQGGLPLEPTPYSEHLLEILRAGGLMALLAERAA